MYFIEMKKFIKELKDVKTTLDRWIIFLNKAHEYSKGKIPAELLEDENIKKAIERLDIMYLDNDERTEYEAQQKARRDRNEEMRTAKEEGKAEGKAKFDFKNA